MHTISIYEAWASGPWKLTFGRLDFECTTCLMNERVRREHTSSGRLQLSSHNCVLERNPMADWTLNGVWKWYWDVRMDASWNNLKLLDTEEGLDGKFLSSGWMMLWTVEHLDGITRRPDGYKGTDQHVLNFAQSPWSSQLKSRLWIK
jgi:hypothetical protein